ncbi:hypothetical protein HED22_05550 [Thalassospira sp. HF15]|uniref:hypothetical protein n=1 Tax=Thalassospira sp. HF15 TaxID=2722755 RepID=UPI00142F97D5|nr:hypothetical protein [Thalassospira sp. HF15]NIY75103.1 hypothetical protein [Thalassospira sp. HF15]
MSQDTLYISPEYNPHSLKRDWGFLVCPERSEIFEALMGDLTGLRATLYRSLMRRALKGQERSAPIPDHPAKVSTDGLSESSNELCEEAGLDIVALALLADVPIHRPLHLTQSGLIGHWRWLREVWRGCALLPAHRSLALECTTHTPPVKDALKNSKNNLAIAELRKQFRKVQQAPDDAELYLSFLNDLTLFCPFIGTELLWRQGRIDHYPFKRSDTKDKEGLIE